MAIDPNIKKKADDIRNKIYGKEVRESLASGLEEMSSDVVETVGRQDEVESQWQNVVDETTGKDVISAPEIIAARDGEANLSKRLSKDFSRVGKKTAKLEDKLYYHTAMENKQPEKMIVWIDDDAFPNVYSKVFPIFQSRNIPLSVAVVTDRVGTSQMITMDQYHEMLESGIVEFLSHSASHPRLDQISNARIHDEFKRSQQWIKENGGNPDYLIYPFGYNNENINNIAREYYKIAVTTDGGINYPPIPSFSLRRKPFEAPDLKQHIDKVATDGGLLGIMSHSHYAGFTTEKINEMLDYIEEKGIPIVSLETAMKHYSNLVDTTEGAIGRNGAKTGKLMGSQYESGLSLGLKGDSKLTSFPNRAKTNAYFGVSGGSGHLPMDKYGLLSTERYVSPDFSRSYFYPLREKGFYLRFWDTTKSDWTEWTYQDTTAHVSSANIDNDTRLANFQLGKTVTTYSANQASTANMPYAYGGIYEVIRHENRAFSRAYFYENQTTKTWVRFVDGSANWTEWEVYNQ